MLWKIMCNSNLYYISIDIIWFYIQSRLMSRKFKRDLFNLGKFWWDSLRLYYLAVFKSFEMYHHPMYSEHLKRHRWARRKNIILRGVSSVTLSYTVCESNVFTRGWMYTYRNILFHDSIHQRSSLYNLTYGELIAWLKSSNEWIFCQIQSTISEP